MEKKIKLQRGLTLNKEAIVKLQDSQMMNLRGGNNTITAADAASISSCWYLLSCVHSCMSDSCNTTAPTTPSKAITPTKAL
jgi:hypothetical protein